MPVRELPRSLHQPSGFIEDKSGAATLLYEFPATDFVFLMKADPDFLVIESKPVFIEYTNSIWGKTYYRPDYLVTFRAESGRRPELVEIMTRSELMEKKDSLRGRFVAAHKYAVSRGWKFKIRTEQKIRGPRLANLRLLQAHERHAPRELRLRRIIKLVREAEAVTFGELISTVAGSLQERAEWLPTIWYAIGKKLICTDLDREITGRSELWVQR